MRHATSRAVARKQPASLDTLVRRAAATASGLLSQSERVLIVYEEGSATLYYESHDDSEDCLRCHKLPRAL